MSKKPQQTETAKGRRTPSPGKAVRPYRSDGYVNVLNKYGTSHDNSEAYRYEREPLVPDMQLTSLYEGNGLFSKIIDTPAEEALKHGYELNINNDELDVFVEDALDELEWEEKAATAIKWARLYGGAIIVMLIDDGRGLEQPVDWKAIKSIDELRVFERAVVQPDYASLYMQDFGGEGKARRTSRFGEPEFYYVNSMYGSFKVHESRCLVFKNGVLPEQISNSTYQMWGMPEYVRIKRALRETTTAHSDSVRLLERSVQAIYKMKNLSQLLATDDGENQVLRRLEVIDMAKGLLNSIAIDSEGEDYDFKTFQFSGVKDVIDSTCNMLSALTNIPQTLLFGRSPSGMNATGDSDLENYYNYVERIQKLMLKKNLRYLLDIIFRAGVASSELAEEPDYKLEFKPLWSMSESEQAAIDQQKAATSLTKAQTTQIYVDMGALDPTEVRSKLASNDEYTVEDIIEDDDEDIFSSVFGATEGQIESEAEAVEKNTNQTAQQTPMQEPITEPIAQQGDAAPSDVDWITTENGTHIPIGAGGEAVGGPLKGENFSQAKSEPSGEKAEKKLTKSSASEMRSKMMGCSEEEAAKKAGEATEGYTGSIAAMNLNKELRKANPNLDDWQKERVQMLDGAMSDLPQDVSLVRGAMKPYAKETLGLKGTETEKQLTKKLVGKEFTEQAYMSTSYDEKANRNSWNDVIMNITAKAGTKALVTTNDEESEVILGRGTRYKVTGVHAQEGGVNGSQIVLDVETLPSSSGSNSDSNETPNCVGVLVIKDGRVLTGVRKSASHPFEICGPGGHIEPGETPEQAAIRETEEEFGITPKDLTPVSVRTGLAKEFGIPAYFVCTEYDGDVRCYDHSEMVAPQWSDLGAVIQSVEAQQDNLFPPFADSIRVLNDVLQAESEKISQEGLPSSENTPIISMKDGGPGSGRYPKGSGESSESSEPKGSSKSEGGASGESKSEEKPKQKFATAKFERKGSTMEVTSDVKVKMGKGAVTLKAGTTITDIQDFAGKGQKRSIDVEKHLIDQYPGTSAGEWSKTKGIGQVTLSNGTTRTAELHWFEHPDVGQVSMKVKKLK